MLIEKIEIIHLRIPFKQKFKHSLKTRKYTDNIIIRISSENNFGIGESLPREYVTGENIDTCFEKLNNNIIPQFKGKNYTTFNQILDNIISYLKDIDEKENSAFAAFETALLNLACKEYSKNIEDILKYLDIQPETKEQIQYDAIISESNKIISCIKSYIIKHNNFKNVKIKISNTSYKKLSFMRKILRNQNIRVDANCAFQLENIQKLIEILNKNKIKYIEQPTKQDYKHATKIYDLFNKNKIKIILDEDIRTQDDLDKIISNPKTGHIPNLRVSKCAGIINTLLMYKKCRENNIQVILGCLVGETILTKINIILAKHLNTLFNEGDYDKFLFKQKIIDNPSFNKEGILKNIDFDINFDEDINKNYKEFLIKSKSVE